MINIDQYNDADRRVKWREETGWGRESRDGKNKTKISLDSINSNYAIKRRGNNHSHKSRETGTYFFLYVPLKCFYHYNVLSLL